MPNARYFRMSINDTKNQVIDISAIHLYNDNARVDQTATLTSGFGLNNSQLAPIRSDVPSETNKVTIDFSIIRKTAAYIVWTFASAVNVNAFRIGSSATEGSFLDKFSLQWSDDGLTYKSFINIALDKKLFFPGPWTLTELKPVGEGFPFVLSLADQRMQNTAGGDIGLRDNYSFNRNANYSGDVPFNQNWSASTTFMQVMFPGIFVSGKYYFEVNVPFRNAYINNNSWGRYSIAFVSDTQEKVDELRSTSSGSMVRGYGLCTNNSSVHTTATPITVASTSAYSPALAFKTFKPGYQCGFAVDFDARQVYILNPSWTDTAPAGLNPITAGIKFIDTNPVNEKIRLAILMGTSGGSILSDSVSYNFGQEAFVNTVPAGYQPCFGPRWKEVPDSVAPGILMPFSDINSSYSMDSIGTGDLPTNRTDILTNIVTEELNTGKYYIKGVITRDPNIQNKRFEAQLFSHQSMSIIRKCVASPSGMYEFYGIKNGLYSIISIDTKSNTVNEMIGPVTPKEII